MRERRRITVHGIVQGVGFRPFVYGLARDCGLAGHVYNDAAGVSIEVEGDPDALDRFVATLRDAPPPLARVEGVAWEPLPLNGDAAFSIATSHHDATRQTLISPDVCICDDCLVELFDPADRRYCYPFINCTNCGPRFTIIQDVPYDRPYTTMAPFPMCNACQREYDDSANRRFHAQPNACPVCGPSVTCRMSGAGCQEDVAGYEAIERTARLLRSGHVVAVKGLGGYHLVCDALNEAAVQRLRERKQRWDKPFALMVADVAAARARCEVSDIEAQLLLSRQRPIVLLHRREGAHVAAGVAPREKTLGMMLPYTPLHYVLFDALQRESGPVALVMTSGNVSDEPIAYRDDEALTRLASLADAFLLHNRAIHMRCDDSVARVVADRPLLLRRSRGYAPEPLRTSVEFTTPILASGAHLKNTFCVAKDHHAFVSHHIGDLENYETLRSFTTGIEHFQRLFDIAPQVVAHDLHPEYLATKYALERAEAHPELTVVGVQHHHAHIAAVTGEHGVAAPVIGVAFDGTGYGTDGTLWGGEFLVADWAGYERVAHLETLPLIGGEQAIRQVWRLAAAWLHQVYADEFLDLDLDFVRRLDRKQWRVMSQMVAKGVNSPRSSAMGRLFDAVAALIGVRDVANYEGQAAIELETIADPSCRDAYPFALTETTPRVLQMRETVGQIIMDLQSSTATGVMAAKFHNTLAAATAAICTAVRHERGLGQVALGGGVFQNEFLLRRTVAELEAQGFEVLLPVQLPPNDGAISFGQAVVANAVVQLEPPINTDGHR